MRAPELLRISGPFNKLCGPPGNIAAGQWAMAEHVAQAFAVPVPDRGDLVVGRTAIGAGIAAIFDERKLGVGRPQDVVMGSINGTVEPARQTCTGHAERLVLVMISE